MILAQKKSVPVKCADNKRKNFGQGSQRSKIHSCER